MKETGCPVPPKKEKKMSNKANLLNAAHEMAEARAEVVANTVRAYGGERRYALALNAAFAIDWFDIEANDKSAEAAPFMGEKGALYQMLRDAKHTNPSTVMGRVRKLGREARYPTPEATGEGAEGAEGEGAEGSGQRSPLLRNMEELVKLFKFNSKLEACPANIAAAQDHIAAALAALGVNVSTIA